METLQLDKDNLFNGMSREDFKNLLISMGFDVEDCDGTGYITFEEDETNKAIEKILPSKMSMSISNNNIAYQIRTAMGIMSSNDFKYCGSYLGVSAA